MSDAGKNLSHTIAEFTDSYHGQLFVVSSPSGGGKGTLISRVLASVPAISYSVSYTTRRARPGEVDGVHYHFVSPEEFEEIRRTSGFLEWAVVHDNLYGTARNVVEQELNEGHDVILEIDVQGAASVRAAAANVITVFILPPSYEVLAERLTKRGTDRSESVALRLKNARGEVERYGDFDYVVINDDAERAAQQLASIVYAERARREHQEWAARRVLATFPRPPAVE